MLCVLVASGSGNRHRAGFAVRGGLPTEMGVPARLSCACPPREGLLTLRDLACRPRISLAFCKRGKLSKDGSNANTSYCSVERDILLLTELYLPRHLVILALA